jgi:hypothetical protein
MLFRLVGSCANPNMAHQPCSCSWVFEGCAQDSLQVAEPWLWCVVIVLLWWVPPDASLGATNSEESPEYAVR